MGAHRVPGDRFGAYEIESELGRGGQGVVYRARQRGTERSVALKLFGEFDDEAKRARFSREAVAAARVEHPNIVPVYESGEVEGVPFIAMRLVPGPSLDEVLARVGGLPPARSLAILADVAAAVDAVHAHHLVHRDIKSANVLLDLDDRAFLSDFGVARLDDMPGLTRRGDFLGTVEYMAPEQVEGHAADARSDLYAFGVMAYEVLTGRTPFVHRQPTAVALAHVNEPPPSVAHSGADLPPALDGVFARALAKDPAHRPPSATGLVDALRRALDPVLHRGAAAGQAPVDAAAGWTAVMRRVTGDDAPPAPPAASATRVMARGKGAPTPPPPSAPAAPPARRPRRGRRRMGLVAALVAVAGLAAGGTLYATSLGRENVDDARETAYHNGFRNGKARGTRDGVARGRKAGYSQGMKEGTAKGREAGYAAGLAEGKRVPDASPGDMRLARVTQDGSAEFVGDVLSPGSCFRIDESGEVSQIDFVSPFVRC